MFLFWAVEYPLRLIRSGFVLTFKVHKEVMRLRSQHG